MSTAKGYKTSFPCTELHLDMVSCGMLEKALKLILHSLKARNLLPSNEVIFSFSCCLPVRHLFCFHLLPFTSSSSLLKRNSAPGKPISLLSVLVGLIEQPFTKQLHCQLSNISDLKDSIQFFVDLSTVRVEKSPSKYSVTI